MKGIGVGAGSPGAEAGVGRSFAPVTAFSSGERTHRHVQQLPRFRCWTLQVVVMSLIVISVFSD